MDECFDALIKICNPNLIHPSSYIKYPNNKLDILLFVLNAYNVKNMPFFISCPKVCGRYFLSLSTSTNNCKHIY